VIPLISIVQVQLLALAAALGAMALASAGYLLRRALGLVKAPPPIDEQSFH
jgi:hypothetical protein